MSADTDITVQSFLQDVGRKEFETELGVTTQVVSRAVKSNIMPAHWFFAVREFCSARSRTVPEHLFRRLDTVQTSQTSQSAKSDGHRAVIDQAGGERPRPEEDAA
ncbi:hypothetical protein [Wenxinia saemankumensis]|uniref:hypothetical protein n=1 Tax=Wenxinia saemankumensis TaxID=1447782 RepID=UPI0009F930CC|nr:hypothetical protein [Wenxinia saemankumensis]